MAATTISLPYVFKRNPHSSHLLLLDCLPKQGDGRRVLDVGCGTGYLAEILTGRGYKVTGVDRPGIPLDRFPANVELIAADLDQGIPDVPGGFSYILCGDILEHLRDPLRLLYALRKLLAPGGVLIASLPNSGNLYFRLNVLAGRFPAQDRGLFDRTHLHFYTWKGWLSLLTKSGFRPEKVAATGIPVGLAVPQWNGSLPIRLLEHLCYGLACLWRKLFAYQFVIVARPGAIA